MFPQGWPFNEVKLYTLYFPHCWTTRSTNVNKCSTRSTDSSIVVLVVSPLQALLEEQVKIRSLPTPRSGFAATVIPWDMSMKSLR